MQSLFNAETQRRRGSARHGRSQMQFTAEARRLSAAKPQPNRGENSRKEAQKAQRVGGEALSSAFLLFGASAIASLSDPSLKGIHRESTEGRRRSSAEPDPKSGCGQTAHTNGGLKLCQKRTTFRHSTAGRKSHSGGSGGAHFSATCGGCRQQLLCAFASWRLCVYSSPTLL
jgi:hypothetical protein